MSPIRTPRPTTDRRPRTSGVLRPAFAGLALAPAMLTLSPGSALAAPGAAGEDLVARVTTVVAPSVAFVHTEATGYVLTHEGSRIGPVTVTWNCSGAVVGADGVIATNGECVDTFEGSILSDRVLYEASVMAADSGEWTLADGTPASQEVIHDTAKESWTVEGMSTGSPLTPDVTVALPGAGELPGTVVAVTGFGAGNTAVLDVVAENLPVLEIAAAPPATGAEVVAVGLEARDDAQTADVTSLTGTVVPSPEAADRRSFDADLELEGSMGGGPLVDADGRLLGLTDFTRSDPAPTTLIRPAAVLQGLLPASADIGLSDADHNFRRAVAAQAAGDPIAALELFDAVLAEVPDHPTAAALRVEAADAAAAAGPQTLGGIDQTVLLASVGTAIVLLLGGALAVVLTRRPRRPAAGTPAATPAPVVSPVPSAAPMPWPPVTDQSELVGWGAGPDWSADRHR